MTITQLEYIIAVDNYRNFAEAARRCYITQPTLSMQIKKLEEELDVLVFDRSKKPVIPTEVGRAILEQAREGLKGLNRIYDLINDQQEGLTGELRVGIIPTLSPYLLPRFAAKFTSKYPRVELIVEEMVSQDIVKKLSSDLLDVGVLVTPLNAISIKEIPLFYEAFFVYMSNDYPLADQLELNPSDLNIADMWVLREGHCFRNQMVNICKRGDKKQCGRPLRFESGSMETLRRIVDRQYGFTLLPELAVLELPPEQHGPVRPFAGQPPLREVSLVTHRSFLKQKLIEAFRAEVIESIPSNLLDKSRGTVVKWQED
ncbi:MAG: LysR family hydrogen peroxide-inducible transcriptional activator [Limisphaerales bacterium]|jgi:LysR family hydrogen peroxide-inducible transcriptional activator